MNITFAPLVVSHFSLLLKWLESPHVKKWWDQDVHWTPALIDQKFGDYVKGYKLDNDIAKPINAYIICVDEKPIGYIQIYNAYDFPRDKPLVNLPESLAAFDILIGEADYLKRGIGSKAITVFLDQYAASYNHVFVDPDSNNIAAIRAYEKAGFKKTAYHLGTNEIWMMKSQRTTIIYLFGYPGTGKYTISQELMKQDFIVCDNQLINNPIFTLLNYDGFTRISELGWNAIARIRTAVFDFMAMEHKNNYVLTNCLYENEGDRNCYLQVEAMALKRDSIFIPVKLLISKEENLKRISEPSRRARWKSIDPQEVYQRNELIQIEHPHLLELDVSALSAAEAAGEILEHAFKLKNNKKTV
jgi:RimJ/RimL family protein N-acetyltransferase